jgi:hypothetical protein
MSDKPSSTGHGSDPGGHGAQVEDQINFPKVIVVGVVSLVAFALCTVWAVKILDSETRRLRDERGEARKATELGKEEIGIVDQVPFQSDTRLEHWRQERREALHGYGWVNRKLGVAHIPIEQAMEQAAAGVAPTPVPGGVK